MASKPFDSSERHAAGRRQLAEAAAWCEKYLPDQPQAVHAVMMMRGRGFTPTPEAVRERLRQQNRLA